MNREGGEFFIPPCGDDNDWRSEIGEWICKKTVLALAIIIGLLSFSFFIGLGGTFGVAVAKHIISYFGG